MTDNQGASARQAEDVEIAAAMAAVAAFAAGSGEAIVAQSRLPANKWRSASLIEAVGARTRRAQRPGGWNSWKSALCLTLLLASLCPSAFATESVESSLDDVPTIAMNTSGPAPAPPIQISVQAEARPFVKVAISLGATAVLLEAPDGAVVLGALTQDDIVELPPQSRWSVSPSANGQIAFRARGGRDLAKFSNTQDGRAAYVPSTAPLAGKLNLPSQLQSVIASNQGYLVVPKGRDPDDRLLVCNGKSYRGALLIRQSPGPAAAISVINVLDVEDYLLSVLPSEMPSTWASGALQAQAIAARSYAIANLGKHAKDGYDLRATTDDQVYLGVASERQSTNDAVMATSGLILKQSGKPISAFFHSTSGGSTEVSENVWGRPLPYLKSVVDYDDGSPHFSWTRKLSSSEIEKVFAREIGQLVSISVVSRTAETNRVKTVLVTGNNGTKLVTGDSLRLTLKLPSSNFNLACEENSYTFAGRGFGHGLGMSQYGAKALAEQGYNAAQILAYYYKDVSVEYVAGVPGI